MSDAGRDWGRVKELFLAPFESGPDERRRFLDAATAGEPELRRRVERLLLAHGEDGVLDRPAISSLEGIDVSLMAPVPSLVGRSLGAYRVVREIGRGGMGAVYEGARHDAQFEKRVAIKTLRLGADSAAMLQRFRQERQILAALEHPNIAALLDGGVTDDGLPYIILEYVDGRPIDGASAERTLALRARLDLFRQVVGAVQYAHRQLVIHRDLKPSNILVDAEGRVKLLDFGIAKLMQGEGPEVTAEARGPLTINYASPEQVKGEPITTATDVYSLGVVLYRLLTGRNPLDLESLSLDRAIRAICGETPPAPSQTATEECARSMGLGSSERLRRSLRGELDAIVLTALRKEPDRRYPTAQAMGDDIQRYLKGLPVSAAPDTLRYRLSTFVRRRRALVAGLAVGTLAVLSGAGVAVWQARAARIEARRATQVAGFLQGLIGAAELSGGSPGARLGPGASVAELLDSAAQRVPSELAGDPEVRSAIHFALGRSYTAQERWGDARSQFDSARRIITRVFGERRLEVARALSGMAEVELLRGGSGADSLAARASAIYRDLDAAGSVEYGQALRVLGVSRAFRGDWAAGDSLLRLALDVFRHAVRGPTALEALTRADLAAVRETEGYAWESLRAQYDTALAMFDSIPGGEVTEKGEVLWYAARLEASLGHLPRADSLSLEALRVFEKASGPTSQNVAQQLAQLAGQARERGDTAAARRYAERAMAVLRVRPEVISVVRERTLLEYARVLWAEHALGRADSAAGAAYRSRLAEGNSAYIAEAGQVYGAILRDEGRFGQSEPVLLDAYRRIRIYQSADQSFARLIAGSLAKLYFAWGKPAAAEPFLATFPDSVRPALRRELGRAARPGRTG